MTSEEFSNSLDTMLNAYYVQAGFGEAASKQGGIALDEYEKSVYLTEAQDNIVKSYFDRTANSAAQGFDDSPRRQVDFSSLIKVARLTPVTSSSHYDDRGLMVKLDKNVLYIVNEKLEVGSGSSRKVYIVVPINHAEYDRIMSKPYAQPLKRQAWRIFSNIGTGYDIQSEIIPIEGVADKGTLSYVVRYVERPTPIITTKLPDGLTVDGEAGPKECALNPILHTDILNEAFRLIIATRGGGTAVSQKSDGRNQD